MQLVKLNMYTYLNKLKDPDQVCQCVREDVADWCVVPFLLYFWNSSESGTSSYTHSFKAGCSGKQGSKPQKYALLLHGGL